MNSKTMVNAIRTVIFKTAVLETVCNNEDCWYNSDTIPRKGTRHWLWSSVGCLIIRIISISEPDGNSSTREQCKMTVGLVNASTRVVLRRMEQIAGNYFMVNGRVMHLRIINFTMDRVCHRIVYVTGYLAVLPDLINSLCVLSDIYRDWW